MWEKGQQHINEDEIKGNIIVFHFFACVSLTENK